MEEYGAVPAHEGTPMRSSAMEGDAHTASPLHSPEVAGSVSRKARPAKPSAFGEALCSHARRKFWAYGRPTSLAKDSASTTTLYLASLIARCGERAAAGDAQGAAGTAAGALMFFDMLHVLGDIEVAWLVALEDDPQAALKTQNLANTLTVPDPAQAQSRKKGTSVRLNFSQLAEAETLEAALEACKSWAGYDTLARGLQTA